MNFFCYDRQQSVTLSPSPHGDFHPTIFTASNPHSRGVFWITNLFYEDDGNVISPPAQSGLTRKRYSSLYRAGRTSGKPNVLNPHPKEAQTTEIKKRSKRDRQDGKGGQDYKILGIQKSSSAKMSAPNEQ
jgi:hypothetical protein